MVLAPGFGSTSTCWPQPRRQPIGDDAHQGIDRTAGIERHDDADGLGRPGRLGTGGEWQGERTCKDETSRRTAGLQARVMIPERTWRSAVRHDHFIPSRR